METEEAGGSRELARMSVVSSEGISSFYFFPGAKALPWKGAYFFASLSVSRVGHVMWSCFWVIVGSWMDKSLCLWGCVCPGSRGGAVVSVELSVERPNVQERETTFHGVDTPHISIYPGCIYPSVPHSLYLPPGTDLSLSV